MNEDDIRSKSVQPSDLGPLDEFDCRKTLDARVCRSADGRVEIHGLDVADDLSRHYSFAEVILTTVVGEPPDETVGRLFEVCCHFAAPVSVAEAPAHAARTAEAMATDGAGAVSLTSVALAEQARYHLERLSGFVDWLEARDGDPPDSAFDSDDALDGLAQQFYQRIDELDAPVPGAVDGMSFWAMLIAALHACGVRSPRKMITVLVTARLPAAASEGQFGSPGRLDDYPVNIPRVEYAHQEARDARHTDD